MQEDDKFGSVSQQTIRALKGEFGIRGLQEKNLGLWDYTLFEIGITEIRSEIGIMGFHTNEDFSFFIQGNWDYGITAHLKLGLPDYTPFEIGITGLQDPPFQGPTIDSPLTAHNAKIT